MAADFRYRRLGYLVLKVSDIDRTTKFLIDVIGLDFVEETKEGGRFFRSGPNHHDVLLIPAATPVFVRASWELETDDDLERAFVHYEKLGLKPKWVPDAEAHGLSLEKAFRVVEPVVHTEHEYYSKMTYISSPLKNRLTGFQGGKHFGLAVPDPHTHTEYLAKNMGFLISDYLEGWPGALLRAFPNPNHHSYGALGGKTGFHHFAFMVNAIDDIGRLMNRAVKLGVTPHFGIGRHPTSGSIHFYVYDPDFFVWEYTLGMEQFPEQGAREARRMSARPEDFDLWDAVPDHVGSNKRPPFLTHG